MSLIDDVVGKKIPTGAKFQAKVGAGSFQKKIYDATKSGALKNLADNKELLTEIASKRQGDIRAGKYTRDKRLADYKNALKNKALTNAKKKGLKAIIEHWGRSDVKEPEVKKAVPSAKANVRAARAATKKAELKRRPQRELPDFLKNRGSISASSSVSSRQPYKPGSGGGMSAGLGGAPSSKPSTGSFRPPSLLR